MVEEVIVPMSSIVVLGSSTDVNFTRLSMNLMFATREMEEEKSLPIYYYFLTFSFLSWLMDPVSSLFRSRALLIWHNHWLVACLYGKLGWNISFHNQIVYYVERANINPIIPRLFIHVIYCIVIVFCDFFFLD